MTTPDDLIARLGRWSAGHGPLYVLLATRIRQLIDDGALPPDTPLPPDRTLAARLAVGRTTVVAAYDLLAQDGKIIRRQGSGTRVAPAVLRSDPSRPVDGANPLFMHLLEPLDNVLQLTCAAPKVVPPEVKDAYMRALDISYVGDIGYRPVGHPLLREAIAARYTRRGVPTSPAEILVTTGGQQALALLAKLLVGPGDRVVVEAPTYPGALEVFRESSAVFRPVDPGDVDAVVRRMREDSPAAVYLIPTHQNPTGSVLSSLARRRIAEAALMYGTKVIEDEVMAEIGFDHAPPPPPIAAYAPVLTVGSLSKVIWGGLRVGWIRGPEALIMQLGRIKAIHDLGSNVPAQLAAAYLVANLDALRAVRIAALRASHDRLCAGLAAHLPSWRFTQALGGQTLWVELPHGDATSFAQRALRHDVALLPGVSLDVSGESKRHLRIPYLEPPDVIAEAVLRIASAWRDYVPSTATSLTSLVV
ncbi:PLP-dependent aminotransferase family protein [Actinocrispum wychmicini]|uniref:DNA-binding transcriptional MocR family regulator n=1 Tax=Actinocrispum wychmicini TaxID=1213861 RepID=A0A4R2J8Q0_9PSEU|nr:PLP-dependent aminotransferase family protein [Actinocrispum wychmicini]TCO55044.1 DNA-binding transcriptional MocR family regulator [Actinocrispum wychmicini]